MVELKPLPQGSSQIKRIGYDKKSEKLVVEFHRGGIYEYLNVRPEVYAGLKGAASPGGYLALHVKGHYPYRKIHG